MNETVGYKLLSSDKLSMEFIAPYIPLLMLLHGKEPYYIHNGEEIKVEDYWKNYDLNGNKKGGII
jgi:hypothetical protein